MLTKDYVVGLVDGEGSFIVNFRTKNRKKPKIEFHFSLKLRYHDKRILEELQTFFNCGRIYIQRDRRIYHSLCYRFNVTSIVDIKTKMIPFFNSNLPRIQSRLRDFKLFTRIVQLNDADHINYDQIKHLKSQMHWGLAVYGKTVRTVGTQSSKSEMQCPSSQPSRV
jgi:hypothetical protein